MSTLYGGMSKSRDITEIVNQLQGSAICNESIANATLAPTEIGAIAESIGRMVIDHYGSCLPESFSGMIQDDAEQIAQIFKNNLVENQALTNGASSLSESALMPSLVTLTASIATTMRTPYEAVLHRLFDTRTLEKQTVEIEEVIPTLRAPGEEQEEDLIDALAPYAPTLFVDRTEILVDELVDGVEPNVKNFRVLVGKNPLFRVNRDIRVTHIEAEIDGEAVPAENIRPAKGTVLYFDSKDNTLNCLFNIQKGDEVIQADISARFDFDKNTLEYLRADDAVKKVYFYATVSHHEHTHPIYTSFRNHFEQYVVPTRPHIEVSLPQEMRTDIANSIQHFANTDIVTAMTENITTISTRMEDQRLKKSLDLGCEWTAEFPFEAPSNFAYGNLEWLKREFIPFLDHCALKLKNAENITDCHFRVGVSPYILRILDTDYTMDKAMTEDGRGSGVINYSIGVKTSTSTFYFISSQQFDDNSMKMLLIPNQWKMAQVRTYNYFRYSSFLNNGASVMMNHSGMCVNPYLRGVRDIAC